MSHRSPFGLSYDDRHHARVRAVQAATLALHHAPAVHYTEGVRRWDGISHRFRADHGMYPKYADCSAFVTWSIWNGALPWHLKDIVNQELWQGGFTGTMAQNGERTDLKHALLADAVLYGPAPTFSHTALYVGGGMVISHGSEGGPYLLPYNYRDDVGEFRRFIR